MHSEVEVPLYD